MAYDFTQNGVGQILSETVSLASLQWMPDPVTGNGDHKVYDLNGLNQYTKIRDGVISRPVHDSSGNLTSDGKGRSFNYSAENILKAVNDNGTDTAKYIYAPDATRRTKIDYTSGSAVTSYFWYTGDQEIMETDASGGTTRRYVRIPGSVDETLMMIDYTLPANDQERWSHSNRLGSTVMVSNGAGSRIEEAIYTYSAYGITGSDNAGYPFRFTGQKLDPETGLYYYKARYYDPETGRFLQTDPIGYEDQMNLYAYVGNDPVNFFDPLGLATVKVYYRSGSKIGIKYNHTYLVVTGKNSDGNTVKKVYRAGPDPSSKSECGGRYGCIRAVSGEEAEAFERDPDKKGQRYGGEGTEAQRSQVVVDNDDPTDSYTEKLDAYEKKVNDSNTKYSPFGPNSNSYTAGAVEEVTGEEFEPLEDTNPVGYKDEISIN